MTITWKTKVLPALAAVTLGSLATSPATAQIQGFATLPPGAINNVQAQVIAKVAQQHSKLRLRVAPYRGGGAVAAAVNGGRAEFGISDIVEMTDAYTGNGQFKGKKMPSLRIAFRVLTFYIGIFVRKDSPIKTVADLKGKRFATEWTAFPNSIPLSNGIMATGGISLADVSGVPTTNIIVGAEDFKAGKTDAFIFAIGAPKVAEVNSSVGGIRLLPIPNTPESLKAVQKVRPDYYLATLPARMPYVGVLTPTTVVADDLVIYTSSKVSEKTVYEFVKAIYPNRADLVKGHPSFNGFSKDQMGKQFTVAKYHPGAIKFFKEVGIWKEK